MTKLEQYNALLCKDAARGVDSRSWHQKEMPIPTLKKHLTKSLNNHRLVMEIWWTAMVDVGIGEDTTWLEVYSEGWDYNRNTQSLKKRVEAMLVENNKPFDEGDYL